MSNIKDWSKTPIDNSDEPPYGAPEGWTPGTENAVVRQQMADHRTQWQDAQWFNWGHVPIRQGDNSFLVSTTVMEVYTPLRRLKLYDTTTIYAEVVASSMSGANTLVSVSCSVLSSSLSSLDVAIIDTTNTPLNVANKGHVLKPSISASFATNLPVPVETVKHHPSLPRVYGFVAAWSFLGLSGTGAAGSYNILSVTNTSVGGAIYGPTTRITFQKSLSTTDYVVICTNGTVVFPFAFPLDKRFLVTDKTKKHVDILRTTRLGVTDSEFNVSFYILIYGSSLED